MRVLIFSAFDGVPYTDEEPMRYAALAEKFLAEGHEVTYIAASFSHLHKKYRKKKATPDRFNLILLPTRSYRSNVSIDRVLSHYHLSLALSNWLSDLDKNSYPQLVIAASPPVNSSYVLGNFCRKHRIPFIIDLQDLWPEEFLRFFPAKNFLRMVLSPLFAAARQTIEIATAVSAVAKDYLDYYRKQIGNKPESVFYLGVDALKFVALKENKSETSPPCHMIMLGRIQSFDYVLKISKAIQNIPDVYLTFAGVKEKAPVFRQKIAAEKLERIEFMEWLDYEKMFESLPQNCIGLMVVSRHSKIVFPNRVFKYFAAGLPVINTIRNGDLEKCIEEHNLGVTIDFEDANALKNAIAFCRKNYSFSDRMRIQAYARANFDRRHIYQGYYEWAMHVVGKTAEQTVK